MAKPTPWHDQYTLLCESCGYILEDLDQSLPCPECGKPITDSLPGSRQGTPFQQQPSFRTTIKTAWMTIHNPKMIIKQMSYDQTPLATPISRYLIYTFIMCSILLIVPDLMFSLFNPKPSPTDPSGFHWMLNVILGFGTLIIIGLLIWTCFFIITSILTVAITITMKLFRTRGDINVAWVIAGHASIGWIFTGFIWLCGLQINSLIGYLVPTHSDWEKRVQMGITIKYVLEPTFLLGLLIGSLVFVYISALGIKQSRHLNLPRQPQESGATA